MSIHQNIHATNCDQWVAAGLVEPLGEAEALISHMSPRHGDIVIRHHVHGETFGVIGAAYNKSDEWARKRCSAACADAADSPPRLYTVARRRVKTRFPLTPIPLRTHFSPEAIEANRREVCNAHGDDHLPYEAMIKHAPPAPWGMRGSRTRDPGRVLFGDEFAKAAAEVST